MRARQRTIWWRGLLAAVACAEPAACPAQAQAPQVHVLNWSDYIDPALLERFERETGIEVVYDVFDSGEVLEARLLAGGTGYDVVVPSASFMKREIEAGVFMPLDPSRLRNLGNLWDEIREKTEHRFIDFMLRPEVIAAASNYVFYANGNKASQPLLDAEVIGDPGIYPPEAVLDRLYVVSTAGPETVRRVTRLWTRIKTGR